MNWFGFTRFRKDLSVCNYIGIGVTAQVASLLIHREDLLADITWDCWRRYASEGTTHVYIDRSQWTYFYIIFICV